LVRSLGLKVYNYVKLCVYLCQPIRLLFVDETTSGSRQPSKQHDSAIIKKLCTR